MLGKSLRSSIPKGFLESKAFTYEITLNTIINQIKAHYTILTRREYELIVEAYISLKQRNPYYRAQIANKDSMSTIIDKVIGELENDPITQLLIRNGFNFSKFTSDFKIRELNDPSHAERTHLNILASTVKGEMLTSKENFDAIVLNNFIIIEASEEDYFLVSDNPGFSLRKNGAGMGVFNCDFGFFDQIVFPINSKQALLIEGSSSNALNLINPLRRLAYVKVSSYDIYQINKSSSFCANSKLFCEDRTYLEWFINQTEKEGFEF